MQIIPTPTVAAHASNTAALLAGGAGAAADEQAFARALDRAGSTPAPAADAPDPAQAAEADARRGKPHVPRGASRLSLAERLAEAHDSGRPPWAAAADKPGSAAPVAGPDPDPATDAGSADAATDGQQLLDLAALMSGLAHNRPAPPAAAQAGESAADAAPRSSWRIDAVAAEITRLRGHKHLPADAPPGEKIDLPAEAALALPADAATAPSPLPAAAQRDAHPGALRFSALAAAAAAAMVPAAAAEAALSSVPARQRGDAELAAVPAAAAAAATPPAWSESLLLRSGEAAVPPSADIREAVGTPEFAPALGHRLSLMVRDGIEQARLDLHPADMGPIEVRIRLDGQQAQVEFIAANALTRQALQEAVPALAGALRESGLTLAGGGVFEQPRERRGEARGDTPSDAFGTTPASRDTAAPVRALRSRGIVDLYA